MKHPALILRSMSQFTPNSPKFHLRHTYSLASTPEIADSNGVLSIINTVNPMEDALERIAPFLTRDIVSSILEEEQNPELSFRFFVWAANRKRFRSWGSHEWAVIMLMKDNGFEMYWKTLEAIKSCGSPISTHAFSVLIEAYWYLRMAEKAVEAFGKMREFDCIPRLFTYNMMLHVLVEKEVILLALAVYNMMLKSNCGPNNATFNILIDGLCRSARTQDALRLFDEMTERGIPPDKITYTVIISGLCIAKRPDEAHKLFRTMTSKGCPPDLITYNALLNGFCTLGRVDEAFMLLRSFANERYALGLNGYSCLINAMFKARRFKEARLLFQKMFKEGITPDLVLYTIMIRGLFEERRVRDAFELLRWMTDNGVVPDAHCYNTMIKGFCDMGYLDQARSLQLEISKNDCFPDSCTYTILISGMCRHGLLGDARLMFNEMEKLGCFPSVETFNALMHGLCKDGKLEEAHLLLYKMEIGKNPSLFLRLSQGSDRVVDSASLQAMVERLCESGLILKAYKLVMQLADNGVPNLTTYNILINGLCKAENVNDAFELLKLLQIKGLSPDSVTYCTLIDGLQRVHREEDAFGVFEQMLKNGCMPHSAVYKSLMTWSCRRNKISVAFSLWLKYLSGLPGWDNETIKLVEQHFEKDEVEEAIRCLIEMDIKLKDFDSAPYNICLIGLCQASRQEEALKIFSFLKEYKIHLSPPCCVMLINSLCKQQNLGGAVTIFLYTLEKGFMLMPPVCNNLLICLLQSQEKRNLAHDLAHKMMSNGYDLDVFLWNTTKSLLWSHW